MIVYFIAALIFFIAVLWYCMYKAFKPIELKVLCPICDGICGVNVADEGEPSDWHDCDFCDCTGFVDLPKAAEYAAKLRKED